MSKIRQITPSDDARDEPVAPDPGGDLAPYVIFTQLKAKGPHIYAGWLDAADHDMALQFAREHYGQDQECVNLWAIPRPALTSSDGEFTATTKPAGGPRTFEVFTQKKPGDLYLTAGEIDADSPAAAIDAARENFRQAASAHVIWVVALDDVLSTDEDDLIWRYTDQTYRLARGYSKQVREKWIAIRDEQKVAEYEKEDLHESF